VGSFGGYVFDGSNLAWIRSGTSDQWPDIRSGPAPASIYHSATRHGSGYEPERNPDRHAYLGPHTRCYFRDESASAPGRVAPRLKGWAFLAWRGRGPVSDEAENWAGTLIASFLAGDIPEAEVHDSNGRRREPDGSANPRRPPTSSSKSRVFQVSRAGRNFPVPPETGPDT